MTIKQILSITVDILTEAKEKSPNRQVSFPVDGGVQKISIDATIAQVKNLYSWCYDQLELKNIIKVCRCKDCKYYKSTEKRTLSKKSTRCFVALIKPKSPLNGTALKEWKGLMTMSRAVNAILNAAKREPKGAYSIYNMYKSMIGRLNLTSTEYEQAIRRLCQILRV